MLNLSKKKNNILKAAFLGSLIMVLTSCLTITSEIVLDSDGKGTVAMTYRISKLFTDMGTSGTDKKAVPLNFKKEDFENITRANEDLTLVSYEESEDTRDVIVTVVLAFDSINAFNRYFAQNGALTMEKEGDDTVLTQVLLDAGQPVPSEESMQMMETLFQDRYFEFKIKVPGTIKEVQGGTASAPDEALFKETFTDFMRDTSKRSWSVRW